MIIYYMLSEDFPESKNGTRVIGLLRSSSYVWVMNPFNEKRFLQDATGRGFEVKRIKEREQADAPTIIDWPYP